MGGQRSRRAATAEHPFGFGRERYIYSFIVAIVLFSVGGLFALYEAYHKWHEVHEGEPNEPLAELGVAPGQGSNEQDEAERNGSR